MEKQKLIFITPKIDESHDDLAFASLWAQGFIDAGFDVQVICTSIGPHSLSVPVHSLGGEKGAKRWMQVLRFWKLLWTIPHDRAYVHMTPRWLFMGCWIWWLRRIPCYLWFTHYTNTISLKIGSRFAKRMFAATKECLPQYEGSPKKVVTGHGIDTRFWNVPLLSESEKESPKHLLAVHRISRSKRLEIVIRALALLPEEYTLTHYGRPQDPRFDGDYKGEIESLIKELGLEKRVRLMGSIPMKDLRSIYPKYQTFINMVPSTIDKSTLEAMYCGGLTPVMSKGPAENIGYPEFVPEDTPEATAEFIRNMRIWKPEDLKQIIEERHSLHRLIEKMSVYIRPGN